MNPPIENYQFVFNENYSSSNLIRKVDNSQDDQNIFVNKTAPTFGENALTGPYHRYDPSTFCR